MTTENVKIAKQVIDACMAKDFDTVRRLVDKNYKLRDPMMSLSGVEELIKMMNSCPSDGKMENLEFIADGNKVIATFDGVNGTSNMRMCSIMTLENGKLVSEEMFYDTAQIPAEMKEDMKNAGKKKAA